MDLEKDDFRTVIEDARARHAAVVNLIFFTDNQALALLRLYVTLSIATVSGAAAGLADSPLIPRPAGWALAAATVVLIVGAGFCLRAMQSGVINLPGREPDFWFWSMRADVDRAAALRGYLDTLEPKQRMNDKLNVNSAVALFWAKRCAVLAPGIGLLAGALALLG